MAQKEAFFAPDGGLKAQVAAGVVESVPQHVADLVEDPRLRRL
jgi:hypothetical protein